MSDSMGRTSRILRGPIFVCTLLACSPALAQTTRSGLDLSTEASAASNPYLSDDDRWVGAGRIDARPWLRFESERDTIDLAGFLSARGFSGIYDLEDSESASLAYRSQRSARVSLYASAGISSSSARSASQLRPAIPGVTDPVNPIDPAMAVTEPSPLLPGDDITLLGLIGRSTDMNLLAGIDNQLDARSFVGLNVRYQGLSVAGNQRTGYDSVTLGGQFVRRVSARTSIGVSGGTGRSRYDGGGTSATHNLEATFDHQLDAYWFLNASLGASTTESSGTQFRSAGSSTGVSGSLDLCNRLPNRNICLNVERAQNPGGLGSAQTVDGVGIRYGARVSARNRIDLYARYSRSKTLGDDSATFPTAEAVSVQASVTRTISNSAEAYAFIAAARTYGGIVANEPSASGGIGVRLLLGRRR